MFQMALIGFIHYKWELVPPLVIQIVLNPVKFYQVFFYLFIFFENLEKDKQREKEKRKKKKKEKRKNNKRKKHQIKFVKK